MNRFHLFAISALICGGLSLVAAVESFAAAQSCTVQEVYPALCKPAHSTGPVANSSGNYCVSNGYGYCFNMQDCVSQYGAAYPGDCEHQGVGGSGGTSMCYQDDHGTVIQVKYYDAFCINVMSGCGCYWSASNQQPPQNVTLCDCRD